MAGGANGDALSVFPAAQNAVFHVQSPWRNSTLYPDHFSLGLVALHPEGYGVAAAEAEGGDAALEVAALQFVQQSHQDARAAGADGMAEGDRAAVHVYLFGIELELARDRDGRYGERFVELDQVHILVALPAGHRQQFFQ